MLTQAIVDDDGTPGLMLIVADGMGGHAGGQVASRIAVETFAGAWNMGRPLAAGERLRAALEIANRAIGARALESPELRGMGCTLVAALMFGDRVRWISVGDSLLLAVRNRELIRLNADHSLAPELDRAVLKGRISQAEADEDPNRHVLLSALSGAPIDLIDEGQQRLGNGTFVLLASDGLLSLSTSRIAELCSGPIPAERKIAALLEAVESAMCADQDNTALAGAHCGAASRRSIGGRRRRRALALLLLALALASAAYVTWLLTDADASLEAVGAQESDRPVQEPPRGVEGTGARGPKIESPTVPSRPQPGIKKSAPPAPKGGPAPAQNSVEDDAGREPVETPAKALPPPAPAATEPAASTPAPARRVPTPPRQPPPQP